MSENNVAYESIEGILGKKLQMTQIFTDSGDLIPVTVIEAGPCVVLQVKTRTGSDESQKCDGYRALQIGFGDKREKRVKKPQRGHFAKAGVDPKAFVREVHYTGDEPPAEIGQNLTVEMFEVGGKVDVVGTSKGRGFSGTIRRHGFHRGPMTHGSHNVRRPGSIGCAADPSRVFKGTRGPGRYGGKRVTVSNLEIIGVDAERNLLLVRGGVPGPTGGYLLIRKSQFASGGK